MPWSRDVGAVPGEQREPGGDERHEQHREQQPAHPRPPTCQALVGWPSDVDNSRVAVGELAQLVDVDVPVGAEHQQHDRQREPDLGRRDHDHEQREGLAAVQHVAQLRVEGDEVDVHRVEHQLDAHQHQHRVAPGQHAVHADREEQAGHQQRPPQRHQRTSRRVSGGGVVRRRQPDGRREPGQHDRADQRGEQQHAEHLERQHPHREHRRCRWSRRTRPRRGRGRGVRRGSRPPRSPTSSTPTRPATSAAGSARRTVRSSAGVRSAPWSASARTAAARRPRRRRSAPAPRPRTPPRARRKIPATEPSVTTSHSAACTRCGWSRPAAPSPARPGDSSTKIASTQRHRLPSGVGLAPQVGGLRRARAARRPSRRRRSPWPARRARRARRARARSTSTRAAGPSRGSARGCRARRTRTPGSSAARRTGRPRCRSSSTCRCEKSIAKRSSTLRVLSLPPSVVAGTTSLCESM